MGKDLNFVNFGRILKFEDDFFWTCIKSATVDFGSPACSKKKIFKFLMT